MEAVTKILFRVFVVYSAVALVSLIVILQEPFGRGSDQLASRPRPHSGCDLVQPRRAAARATALRHEVDALRDSTIDGKISLRLRRLEPCLSHYEDVAEWYERAVPNWRSVESWKFTSLMASVFIVPAWLLWAIIRWAIIAPLRARWSESSKKT